MMATADFDEILGRIRGLLTVMGSAFTSEETAEVDELLDHAELGEALRTLAWLIVEESKQVTTVDVREIEALAARMDITDELPEQLAQPGIVDGVSDSRAYRCQESRLKSSDAQNPMPRMMREIPSPSRHGR